MTVIQHKTTGCNHSHAYIDCACAIAFIFLQLRILVKAALQINLDHI